MTSHDPTQLNRQGADRGTQYRSVIYYQNEEQKQTVEKVVEQLKAAYADPIVTEITAAQEFHVAEAGHQNYYNENSDAGYCQARDQSKNFEIEGDVRRPIKELK